MAGIRRVNRIALDGTTVTLTVGTHVLKCSKQSYGDSLTTSMVSNLGSQKQDGQTPGSYKTDQPSFTLFAAEYRELLDGFPSNGFGNYFVPVVVTYSHPDLGSTSDLLENFRFLTQSTSAEAGEKAIEQEVKGSCMQIYWGEKRKTLNYIPGKPRARGTIF